MKRCERHHSSIRSNVCFALLLLLVSASRTTAKEWEYVPKLDAYASAALSSHVDGRLYMAAVSVGGSMLITTTTAPSVWATAKELGPRPAAGFALDTAPVFAQANDRLYLFARGGDNNLYWAVKKASDPWTPWFTLTWDGDVGGRISVTLTRAAATSPLLFHTLYTSSSGAVRYRQFSDAGVATGIPKRWDGAQEGTIGSDGSNEVLVAIKYPQRMQVENATGYARVNAPNSWYFTVTGGRIAEGVQGQFFDISNVVFFNGSFHLAYTWHSGAFYSLNHSRFRQGKPDDGYYRMLRSYSPTSGVNPQAELCVYRNKLVAAYRGDNSGVYYARWDTADPTTPWTGFGRIGTQTTGGRPSLATFNRRATVSAAEGATFYASANFGNDLFAAIRGLDGFAEHQYFFVNFSREIFRREIGFQFTLYKPSATFPKDNPCNNDPRYAPTSISLKTEDRPVLTEIGYGTWALPSWFASSVYQRQAQGTCQAGGLTDVQTATGWYKPPCSYVRYPLIIAPWDALFVCHESIWFGQAMDARGFFEELGHATADVLGIHDDGKGPTVSNAETSKIPLAALSEAASLFNERVGTCSGKTRCRGFTGFANNYDVGSRQHSFIYVVYFYFLDGDQLRKWIAEDLSVSDMLLKRKYEWVKKYLFSGRDFKSGSVEFSTDSQPKTAL